MEPRAGAGELVSLQKEEDGVAIIEFNNPPANTFSYDMMHQLDEAILRVRFDESINIVVLRGAGEKFFCSGADVKLLYEYSSDRLYYFCLHIHETLARMENTPKLFIAALNGHTVGGGLEIAMACDMRLAKKGGGGHRPSRSQARRAAGFRRDPAAAPAHWEGPGPGAHGQRADDFL